MPFIFFISLDAASHKMWVSQLIVIKCRVAVSYSETEGHYIYLEFQGSKKWDSTAALNGLQSCLTSVHAWMSMNKLKLNPVKAEFLLLGTNDSGANTSLFPIELFGVESIKTNVNDGFNV